MSTAQPHDNDTARSLLAFALFGGALILMLFLTGCATPAQQEVAGDLLKRGLITRDQYDVIVGGSWDWLSRVVDVLLGGAFGTAASQRITTLRRGTVTARKGLPPSLAQQDVAIAEQRKA